jgi:cytochrome c-type biogenesis protein CcmH/NrfF
MDKQQLNNRLEELHGELQQIESVDENERQILQKVMSDIKKLVEEGETDQQHVYDRLGEGLRQGIELFEASHPRATMLMGQVVDALAKMGI